MHRAVFKTKEVWFVSDHGSELWRRLFRLLHNTQAVIVSQQSQNVWNMSLFDIVTNDDQFPFHLLEKWMAFKNMSPNIKKNEVFRLCWKIQVTLLEYFVLKNSHLPLLLAKKSAVLISVSCWSVVTQSGCFWVFLQIFVVIENSSK